MSGGSYDYAYCKVDDMADELVNQEQEYRRVFGNHLKLVAKAMKAVEWVDSCDCSFPHDSDAIAKVIYDFERKTAEVLCQDARELITKLENKIKELN